MRIKNEIFCFAHFRWCHNGWASNILIVVDAGVDHSKYWMPIHNDTIEDGQNKNLIFYSPSRVQVISSQADKVTICLAGHHRIFFQFDLLRSTVLWLFKGCGMGQWLVLVIYAWVKPGRDIIYAWVKPGRDIIYAWVKPGRDIVLMVFSFLLRLLLLLLLLFLLLKTFLCSPVTQKLK